MNVNSNPIAAGVNPQPEPDSDRDRWGLSDLLLPGLPLPSAAVSTAAIAVMEQEPTRASFPPDPVSVTGTSNVAAVDISRQISVGTNNFGDLINFNDDIELCQITARNSVELEDNDDHGSMNEENESVSPSPESLSSPSPTNALSLMDTASDQVPQTSATNAATAVSAKRYLRPAVIDASNVAIQYGMAARLLPDFRPGEDKVFDCNAIYMVANFWMQRGHKVYVVLPRPKTMHKFGVKNKHCLKMLMTATRVVPDGPDPPCEVVKSTTRLDYQPEGNYRHCDPHDDLLVLDVAKRFGGFIVSHDKFRDEVEKYPEYRTVVDERLLDYSFINRSYFSPPDPRGRYGPSRDEIVRFPVGEVPPAPDELEVPEVPPDYSDAEMDAFLELGTQPFGRWRNENGLQGANNFGALQYGQNLNALPNNAAGGSNAVQITPPPDEPNPFSRSNDQLNRNPFSQSNYQRSISGEKFTLFYGSHMPFSNHYQVPIEVEGIDFCCTEQYYQFKKAGHFADDEMAMEILRATSAVRQMDLAKGIRNFSQLEWDKVSENILWTANEAKYVHNQQLRAALFATAGTTLAETSLNRYWGTGCLMDSPQAHNRRAWPGRNKFGELLTKLRDQLMHDDRFKDEVRPTSPPLPPGSGPGLEFHSAVNTAVGHVTDGRINGEWHGGFGFRGGASNPSSTGTASPTNGLSAPDCSDAVNLRDSSNGLTPQSGSNATMAVQRIPNNAAPSNPPEPPVRISSAAQFGSMPSSAETEARRQRLRAAAAAANLLIAPGGAEGSLPESKSTIAPVAELKSTIVASSKPTITSQQQPVLPKQAQSQIATEIYSFGCFSHAASASSPGSSIPMVAPVAPRVSSTASGMMMGHLAPSATTRVHLEEPPAPHSELLSIAAGYTPDEEYYTEVGRRRNNHHRREHPPLQVHGSGDSDFYGRPTDGSGNHQRKPFYTNPFQQEGKERAEAFEKLIEMFTTEHFGYVKSVMDYKKGVTDVSVLADSVCQRIANSTA